MIPYREFDGEPGDYSVDTQGPIYLQKDLDKLFHMFNPEAEFEDGTPGGITSENFAHSAAEDYDFLEHIGAKFRGTGYTAQEVIDLIAGEIGVLDNLTTTQKDSLVDAINELDSNIGDLSDLPATDQSSIVAAINDIYDNKIEPAFENAEDALSFIGMLTSLYTTAKSNLVDAINEIYMRQVADRMDISYLEGAVGDLTTLSTTDKTSLVGAINELASAGSGTESVIGLLTDLETTDKSNIVAAINEVNSGVNDLEVGGRNLVRNTRDYNGWTTSGSVDFVEGEPTGTIVFNAGSGTREAGPTIGVPFALIRKQKISISMMVHMESTFSTRNISVTLILSSTPGGSQESVAVMQKSFVPDGGWQRITLEWELTDSSFLGTADLDNCYVRPKISTNSNADIMVKEFIIETGKISAAWTPAPEDFESENAAVAEAIVATNESIGDLSDMDIPDADDLVSAVNILNQVLQNTRAFGLRERPTMDIDELAEEGCFGITWVENDWEDTGGTKPEPNGQGYLFTVLVTDPFVRQVYISITSNVYRQRFGTLGEPWDPWEDLPLSGAVAKAESSMQKVTGHYEGTGQYGSSHKNSIQFPDYFMPTMVAIGNASDATSYAVFHFFPAFDDYSMVYVRGDGIATVTRTFDVYNALQSVAIEWYNDNAIKQMNESQTTYYWYAIGEKVG